MVDPLHLRTVLIKYYPKKNWRLSEQAISYQELEWFDEDPKPTVEQINALYQEIVKNAWREEHISVRKAEYPPVEDLIIALWEKLVEQDGLTSKKINDIQVKRQRIKDLYPKLSQPRETPFIEIKKIEPDTFA